MGLSWARSWVHYPGQKKIKKINIERILIKINLIKKFNISQKSVSFGNLLTQQMEF
jgi:hypothetical protein